MQLEETKGGSGFKPTAEQEAILRSEGNIRINAVAGSGKTTTILRYALSRPKGARILYLAFNKSVKMEAAQKFRDLGLSGVAVETAHSLAYRHVVPVQGYRVKAQGYKTHEIAQLLELPGGSDKHLPFILANHVNRFMAYFCNSAHPKVQGLNYADVVSDKKARAFVQHHYAAIEEGTRQLLARMNRGEIEITHDFYLKKFQLSLPRLPYDYILFDEGQDASGAMLDLFLHQEAVKVIVGDTHQQIYGWRFAVNSLEKVDFPQHPLSRSFRFTQVIANLATEILGWKDLLQETTVPLITGAGTKAPVRTRAIIARTNLGLLVRAIQYLEENKEVEHLYFEGNIHSYTYADDGASLYDVLSLYNKRPQGIRDKLIASMATMEELEAYIEQTEDQQLSMMAELVREYGNALPGILQSLKARHVGDGERQKAEVIFSTVHRCKGLEYDSVELVPDFISEGRILRLLQNEKEAPNRERLNEEINLLYVAITRTKGVLKIPEDLVPKDFPPSSQVIVVKAKREKEKKEGKREDVSASASPRRLRKVSKEEKEELEQAYADKKREGKVHAHATWTHEMDNELRDLYASRVLVRQIAQQLGRSESAVMLRIRKLELE